ncbi:MAG TPA: CoB--CoM heterodisulfide reductase iron-sulfur subunit A family protein, partial [Bryobacterales bacterium]|nr:CoB--CoM heterodisulfide reductase iron-sulfur subunit A family protein [Bryobacterales bacterium]
MSDDIKIGIYLCEGCGIAEAVNMDELEQAVSGEYQVAKCQRHAAFCSDEGRAVIEGDVKGGEVNRVLVAACSHRVMTDRFDFDGAVTVRANLREQVAWTQPPMEEDTQSFAKDNVMMGIAQARTCAAPEPHENVVKSEKLLVVGGGIAGLTAALDAAKTGREVTLVEKTDQLGGWTRKWSRLIPSRPPYRGLVDNDIEDVIKAVESNDRITVMLNTIVASTAGEPGEFTVTLSQGGTESEDVFGSIVVATGWRMPDDMSPYEKYGLGSVDGVISGVDFEEVLKNDLQHDGRKLNTIAIVIPCESEAMPFTSGVADRIAIKQAIQVMDADPSAMVYVLHDNLRAHGQAEELYREAQEKGVVFMKAMVKSAAAGPQLVIDDLLLGREATITGLDAVVVQTGMMPNSTNPDLPQAEKGNEFLCDDVNPRVPITVNGQPAGDGDEAKAEGDGGEGAAV